MPRLTVLMLGSFQASLDGQPITAFESNKVRALLSYLAVEGNRPHARTFLAGLLWPDYPEQSALANLRHVLGNLRHAIQDHQSQPPFLIIAHNTVQLNPDGDIDVDVSSFRLLSHSSLESHIQHSSQKEPSINDLETAIALIRGSFLEGFSSESSAFEEWALAQRERIRLEVLNALHRLAYLHEGAGDLEQAITYTRRELELEPWDEETQRLLMRALAKNGQRSAALSQYEICRRLLKQELSIEPSPETHELYTRIREGTLGLESCLDKPAVEHLPPKSNLPIQLTSFVGRRAEVERVCELVNHHRLVTLTGAGGVGKTRLALKAAETLLPAFRNGAWLADLAPLSDPEQVPVACGQALGFSQKPNIPPLTQLALQLAQKQLLLVLDNCEHVLAACALLADTLLKACPGLSILATSREILSVPGELTFRVPSLATPDADHLPTLDELGDVESVHLFVERAAQNVPGFVLNETNAPALAQICRRLDGIPLALELAAARVRVLAPGQIAARLNDVFHLLTGGSPAELPRHRTLRAMIDWSYALLSPKERLLLQRLTVFSGGCTLEAAEAACADGEQVEIIEVVELLGSLVDKSLVTVAPNWEGSHRYYMLETIRQYGREQLLAAKAYPAARDRHLDYFAALTKQAEPHLRAKGMVEWFNRFEEELDNLNTTMEWALQGRIELGLQIAADLMWFWWIRNHLVEGASWLTRLLAADKRRRDDGFPPDQSLQRERDLQRARGLRANHQCRIWDFAKREVDRVGLEESVALLRGLGAPARRELAVSMFSSLSFEDSVPGTTIGHTKKPSPDLQEILAIFEQENMLFEISEYLGFSYYRPYVVVEVRRKKAELERSQAIKREIGDLDGIAGNNTDLVQLALNEGDYPLAEALANEAIAICRQVGNHWFEATCYMFRMRVELAQGKETVAVQTFQSGLAIYQDPLEKWRMLRLKGHAVDLAWAHGEFSEAVRIAGNILQDDVQDEKNANWQFHFFSSKFILAKTWATLAQGEPDQAAELLKAVVPHALSLYNQIPDLTRILPIFQILPVLLSRQGAYPQAARLFGFLDAPWQLLHRGYPPRDRQEHDQALARVLAGLGEEEFAQQFAAGQALSEKEALAYLSEVLETNRAQTG